MPSLADLAWPRQTARLLIRPATEADAAAAWAYNRLPEVTDWLTLDIDEAAFVERWSDPEKLPVRLVAERDGELVGDLMVRISDPYAQPEVAEQARGVQAEIGWTIAPAHQGQGYATEAAADLLAIAFDELGLRRVRAECFAANIASWRVMEKIGMRRELASRADALHRTRGWLDSYEYGLLATEWRAREAGSASGAGAARRSPSLIDVAWPRRTERLVLRPPIEGDRAACWRYVRRPEVTEWLTTVFADEDAFADWFDDPGRHGRTIVVEHGDGVIGHLVLNVEDAMAQAEVAEQAAGVQAEVGYVFDPSAQGQGFATEALQDLLVVAFEELGLRRVWADCFADNVPSWRLMERVGMRRELASKEEALHRTRGWLDGYAYALLATEWRALRGAADKT